MAYRDRTKDFLETRCFYVRKRGRRDDIESVSVRKGTRIQTDQEVPLIGTEEAMFLEEGGKFIEKPKWVEYVDNVNSRIQLIQIKIDSLSKLHTRRLMVRFDGSEDRLDSDIDALTGDITTQFKAAEKQLQRVASFRDTSTNTRTGTGTPPSVASRNLRKNAQHSLAKKLQNISSKFRKSQQHYLSKVKHQKLGSKTSLDFLEDTDRDSFTDEMMMEYDTMVDTSNSIVAQRDEEIRKIAKSVQELSNVFKQVASLVIDQGTIVDRIDYHMDQAVEKMTTGLRELHRAERYDKSSRPARCISLLVILISFCFIALVLKHT